MHNKNPKIITKQVSNSWYETIGKKLGMQVHIKIVAILNTKIAVKRHFSATTKILSKYYTAQTCPGKEAAWTKSNFRQNYSKGQALLICRVNEQKLQLQ